MISSFDRIVFIHIQKTAGTSIVNTLSNHYGKGESLDHGKFVNVAKKDLPAYRFITGHFGYEYQNELPGNNYRFTFLRDPVDRVVSLYYFCRENDPSKYEIYRIASELSLIDFVRSENPLVRSHINNVQTWQLAKTWFPDCRETFKNLDDRALLDEAKQHLLDLSFVGITENYVRDSQKIYADLGLSNVPVVHNNASKTRPTLENVSREILDAIREQVGLDEELYRFAKSEIPQKNPSLTDTLPISIDSKTIQNSIRAIAFYLPQFHRVPENDQWWGEGFTEWTNVKRAKPLYEGHDQPRKPGPLGYYDLTDSTVMKAQIALAREHGLSGFCFYHYRFGNGRQILEMPVFNILQSPELDFPFCVCWANESWTRTWDGGEKHVLVEQTYSEEDAVAFAEELVVYFKDSRYIRVAGKPLVVIYRSHQIPDAAKYAEIWRKTWRNHGIGEVYLCAALTGNTLNPTEFGFDAGVEFPPHRGLMTIPPQVHIASTVEGGFEGQAFDYRDWVAMHIATPNPNFTAFRTVMMAWDNTARRGNRAKLFVNCNPAIYEAWLSTTIQHTLKNNIPEERIVFINAWNEWAEGTYLEPDETNGFAYLKATKAAIEGNSRGGELFNALANAPGNDPTLVREAQIYLTSLNDYFKPTFNHASQNQDTNPVEMIRRLTEKLKDKQSSYHEMRRKRDDLREEFNRRTGYWTWRVAKPFFNLERVIRRMFKK